MKNLPARKALLILAYAVIGGLAVLVPVPSPSGVDVDPGYSLDYRVVDLEPPVQSRLNLSETLEQVTGFTNLITQETQDGKEVVVLRREERMADHASISWNFVMDKKDMGLLRAERRVVSRSGKTVREAWVDFRDPMFNYPARLAHIDTIAQVIQAMPLAPHTRQEFYVMVSLDLKPWRVFANVGDIERITVPAGAFNCYRVTLELDYDELLGNWAWGAKLIRNLVPEYTFWVDTRPPHNLVRFTGKLGLQGTATQQAWELVKVRSPYLATECGRMECR